MIRLIMFLLFVALILTGASGVIARGWQVTHTSQPTADVTKAKPAEIIASLIAWTTSAPERDLPALTKEVAARAPWLPQGTVLDAQTAVVAAINSNEDVASAIGWVKSSYTTVVSSLGLSQTPAPVVSATKPQAAPVPTQVVAQVAPVPAKVAPAPAPVPAAVPAPAPKVVTSTTTAVVQPPAAAKPVITEVANNNGLTLAEKGCALGGLAGTGASLVIGPSQIAAWATGAAVLPSTARLVGTVIAAALVTGCTAGALVAPAVAK